MENLYNLTSILNVLLIISAMIGGYMALRSGKHRTSSEIQAQVIDALKAELEALQRRMDSLEKENTRLTQTLNLIRSALRKRGLNVTIDGNLVTIDGDSSSQSGHIQEG